MENVAGIHYIETKESQFLEQYVELRRRVYLKQYPWLHADFGFADETDRVSRIVIALRDDGIVAGGARLTVSSPSCARRMPLEEANFSLRDCGFLEDLDLRRNPYGEVSRMAVDPECARGFEISSGLGNALCALAAREGLDVLFSICPEKPARINHINAKRGGIGFRRYQQLPTVFGVDMALCAVTGLLRVYKYSGDFAGPYAGREAA